MGVSEGAPSEECSSASSPLQSSAAEEEWKPNGQPVMAAGAAPTVARVLFVSLTRGSKPRWAKRAWPGPD